MRRTRTMAVLALVAASACTAPQAPRAPQELVKVTGEVTERWRAPSANGALHGMLRLRAADGRTVLVDLGALGGEGTIAAGDRVTVEGAPTRVAGEPALFAHYIFEHTR